MIPSRVIIEVLTAFDEVVSRAVRAALARGVGSITIDFTNAARVDAVALAKLARELARDGEGAITLEGLSHEQERLLRYLRARLAVEWTRGPIGTA